VLEDERDESSTEEADDEDSESGIRSDEETVQKVEASWDLRLSETRFDLSYSFGISFSCCARFSPVGTVTYLVVLAIRCS
jgi:hypothetical protein